MHEQLIRAQGKAAETACERMGALRESLEEACRLPADAGGSIMPSIGGASPPLTMIASALRVGDHIVHRIRTAPGAA